MKPVRSFAIATLLTLLASLIVGCKSMTVERARQRSEKIQPAMSIDQVYKILGKPRETFAGIYVWEYYWPGQGENRLLRVEFEENNGKWVVRNWRWQ